MNLCIIILITIILIIIIISIVLIVKYSRFLKNIRNIGNSIETAFPVISYPRMMPKTSTIYNAELSKLGISSVMSAINIHQGEDPMLPDYLRLEKTLPESYGVILKPVSTTNIDYIIAFRGTLSHADVITDIKWTQINYFNLGNVHQGFAELAIKLYPYIDIPPYSRVLITGHSLGASVAELIATRLSVEKNIKSSLYISARPRTGDLKWDNNVKKFTQRYILINQSDDIPQMPLPTMVREDIGYGYISPPENETVYFDFQSGNIGNNHNPLIYHYALYDKKKPFNTLWYIPISYTCSLI